MNVLRNSFLVFFVIIAMSGQAMAAKISKKTIYISVSSNFTDALKEVISSYKKTNPKIDIKLISGSTTNISSQIINGAPFDIFFSADEEHADLLIKNKLALKEESFIYAKGRLALWSPKKEINYSTKDLLLSDKFNHIAIAKPDLAPYGRAAKEVLEKLGLFKKLKLDNKLIYGQNISGVMTYMINNNADIGFIALSQMNVWQKKNNLDLRNDVWIIPQEFHKEILQKVVILNTTNRQESIKFLNFVRSKIAKDIIISYGYN